MMPKLYWLDLKGLGRIAISARPRRGDWLDDEVAGWRSQGMDAEISLLTPDEERDLQLTEEANTSRVRQPKFLPLPIEDRNVPASSESAAKVVPQASDLLHQGRGVAIHCRQGIGRSAVTAALVLEGLTPQEVLNRIGSARGLPVPETPEQPEWVKRLAERQFVSNQAAARVPAR